MMTTIKKRIMLSLFILFTNLGNIGPVFSQTEEITQNTLQSVFKVEGKSSQSENFQGSIGSGFVIEYHGRNILVSNFHVISIITDEFNKSHTVNNKDSIVFTLENMKGQEFSVDYIIGGDPISDLVLFNVKDYEGPVLKLDDGSISFDDISQEKTQKFSLAGFPYDEFDIIGDISQSFNSSSVYTEFLYYSSNGLRSLLGASGSPILNDQEKVVAVATKSSNLNILAINLERLQELLNQTINQTIPLSDVSVWVEERRDSMREMAKKGDSHAQYELGLMFIGGKEVEEDYEKAVSWFTKAAEQGSAVAQYELGLMFFWEMGVEQDYEKAVFWFTKAAKEESAVAQYQLGLMFFWEMGVEQDYEKALFWFTKAAKQGVAYAQYQLGRMFFEGKEVEQDYEKAIFWFTKAAEQGMSRQQRTPERMTLERKL